VVFHIKTEAGHNTDWWLEERQSYETFVEDHPRDPLPDKISWETERIDRYNRAHWLVIDRLGNIKTESALTDTNLLHRGSEYDFGMRLNAAIDRGRRVLDVAAGSNAEAVNLRTGDFVVEVDGHPVQDARSILERMLKWEVGGRIELVVERGGQRQTLSGTFRPVEVESAPEILFPRNKPSGRVDLIRRGNTIEASTHGVTAFTLLLSSSKFDFRQPVRVVANGATVFDAKVEPSVATLMKWAARDNDRTMLFGAELNIDLSKGQN